MQVQAKAGSLPVLTFNLTATVPAASIQLVSGGGQSVLTGSQFPHPVVVKVVNSNGQGLAGIPVAFSASNGGCSSTGSVPTPGPRRAAPERARRPTGAWALPTP